MKIKVKKDTPPERKLKAVLLGTRLYTRLNSHRQNSVYLDAAGLSAVCGDSLDGLATCLDAVSIYEGDTIKVVF